MKTMRRSSFGSASIAEVFVQLMWASVALMRMASSARTPLDCSFDELTKGNYVLQGDLSCRKDLKISGAVDIYVEQPATISGLRLHVKSGSNLLVSGHQLTLTAPKRRTADDTDVPVEGGALNLVRSNATFKNPVMFKDNMAYYGGAIATDSFEKSDGETSSENPGDSTGRCKLTFEAPVVFSGNQAVLGMSDTSQGAVMLTRATDVLFRSPVLFTNNAALISGGIYDSLGTYTFAATATFRGNAGGGASVIFGYGTAVNFYAGSTFADNRPTGEEGGYHILLVSGNTAGVQLDGSVAWRCFRPTGNNVGPGFAVIATFGGDRGGDMEDVPVAPAEPCSKSCQRYRLASQYGSRSGAINLPALTVPPAPFPVYDDDGQEMFIYHLNEDVATALCTVQSVEIRDGKDVDGPPLPFWIDPKTSQFYRQVTAETRASLCGQDVVTAISCNGADTTAVFTGNACFTVTCDQ